MDRKLVLAGILLVVFTASTAAATVPENMTLRISGLEGEFYTEDGKFAGTKNQASYPYIITEHERTVTGIVGYGKFVRLQRSGGTVSMTQETTGFLVPLFTGDRSDIEERRESVVAWELLGKLEPSFSSPSPEPTVKIYLDGDYIFDGNYAKHSEGTFRIRKKNGKPHISLRG